MFNAKGCCYAETKALPGNYEIHISSAPECKCSRRCSEIDPAILCALSVNPCRPLDEGWLLYTVVVLIVVCPDS